MRRLIVLHRWLGLLTALLVVVPALTAILINHRDRFKDEEKAVGGPFDQYILCTAIDPRDQVWMGTSEGLYRSTDGGRSFAAVSMPEAPKQVVAILCEGDSITVALRYSGIFRSLDDGRSWTSLPLPSHAEVAALSMRGKTLLATTPLGVYRVENGVTTLLPRPAAPLATPNTFMRLVYDLHDGRFWGRWGVAITDAASLAILLLVASGVVMFFRIPRRRPRPAERRGTDADVADP